jgi:HlyD family secretion protein
MKKRTILWISVIIVILAGAFVAKKVGWIGKKPMLEVNIEKVELRSITETVAATGEIQPEVEVKISADVSGEIVELLVREGQKVKKGEHLLTINPDMIKAVADRVAAGLNQTKAALANARARENQVKSSFLLAESNYNRTKKLHQQKAVSDAEFDQLRTQYESGLAELEAAKQNTVAAEFSVKSAEASLKEATDNLNRTRIYAPTEGTISKLNIELGERVVGTAQMSGTELLRIADMREMEVNALVNENDIVRVHLGDTSSVEVEAFSGRKFKGLVTEIARSAAGSGMAGANTNSGDKVVNFMVKIRILRDSYSDLLDTARVDYSPFFPGMNATVDIQTKIVRNVPGIPIMAVTIRSEEDFKKTESEGSSAMPDAEADRSDENMKEVVFLFENGKAKMIEIETGIQDNNFIQVTKGLKAGQEVISGPYSAVSKMLGNGTEVERIRPSE